MDYRFLVKSSKANLTINRDGSTVVDYPQHCIQHSEAETRRDLTRATLDWNFAGDRSQENHERIFRLFTSSHGEEYAHATVQHMTRDSSPVAFYYAALTGLALDPTRYENFPDAALNDYCIAVLVDVMLLDLVMVLSKHLCRELPLITAVTSEVHRATITCADGCEVNAMVVINDQDNRTRFGEVDFEIQVSEDDEGHMVLRAAYTPQNQWSYFRYHGGAVIEGHFLHEISSDLSEGEALTVADCLRVLAELLPTLRPNFLVNAISDVVAL